MVGSLSINPKSTTMKTKTLKAGTIVQLHGIPVELVSATTVKTASGNWDVISSSAAEMGRKGGSKSSEAKAAAVRDYLESDIPEGYETSEYSVVEIKIEDSYYAILADDGFGPAYGVGTTLEEAALDAAESGFGDDNTTWIRITKDSFDAIKAGNPDAVIKA